MGDIRLRIRHPIAFALFCLSAGSLTAQELADEPPAGHGVLCLGTLIYIADDYGRRCKPGEDAEFQARLSVLSGRFDAYIIKNGPADEKQLAAFKEDEGIGLGETGSFCTDDDVVSFYEHFRDADAATLEAEANELLRRDGPPSFGDCL